MNYEIRYFLWLNKAGADLNELPEPLINLIRQYNKTLNNWEKASLSEQKKYYSILEKTDAYIAACIYKQFKEKIQSASKAKLLTLKIKAAEFKSNN